MIVSYRQILTVLLVFLTFPLSAQIPDSSQQVLLVVTEDADAKTGRIAFFEREEMDAWEKVGIGGSITVGRTGLANGLGIHDTTDILLPNKVEGDGKSPSGVFRLSRVFAFDSAGRSPEMPFVKVTEALECVDDSNSEYYTQIIERTEADSVDWNSSEKMYETTPYYLQGIVAEHNTEAVPGRGSCIFLHYWKTPGETTAGCTAMNPELLHAIIQQLDKKKNPVLVQLTETDYNRLKEKWSLPRTPTQNPHLTTE